MRNPYPRGMQSAEDIPPPPTLDALIKEKEIALFLDFDGTLVELASTPDGIDVAPGLGEQLASLEKKLDGRLALVSGRAIIDLENHLGPLGLAVSGSHGSDCRLADGASLGDPPSGLPPSVLSAVQAFAAAQDFDLEDKPHGAALHYRKDETLEEKGLAFAKELADAHQLDVKRGKCVIELVGQGANKGSAVAAFMDQALFSGAFPVFVGDDVTDEDGFRQARELGGMGIIVGERTGTIADYRLASVAAVHHWLGLWVGNT